MLPSLDTLIDSPWLILLGGILLGVGVVAVCGWFYRSAPTPAKADVIQTFFQGYNKDRRYCPRREGNQVEVELCDEHGAPLRGWISDRSVGGLCVLLDQPIQEGQRFRIRPRSSTLPWAPVLIKNCREGEDCWEVGCQFIGTPPYSLLLHFG